MPIVTTQNLREFGIDICGMVPFLEIACNSFYQKIGVNLENEILTEEVYSHGKIINLKSRPVINVNRVTFLPCCGLPCEIDAENYNVRKNRGVLIYDCGSWPSDVLSESSGLYCRLSKSGLYEVEYEKGLNPLDLPSDFVFAIAKEAQRLKSSGDGRFVKSQKVLTESITYEGNTFFQETVNSYKEKYKRGSI